MTTRPRPSGQPTPPEPQQTTWDYILATVTSASFISFVIAVVGAVAVLAGGIMYLLIEETRNFAVSVLIVGLVLLFLALVLSPRAVALFLVGRRGRYGTNVLVMGVAFFAIAILVNFLFYRNPTRVDVTSTRILTLSKQTKQILKSLKDPIRANAFFVPTDPAQELARRRAEDLLNEFARQTQRFTYRFEDPELNPELAQRYEVVEYPAIVFENLSNGARQAIFGSFSEQDFVTGILIASGQKRKKVYLLTGHKERSITRDLATGEVDNEGIDFVVEGLQRDNYAVQTLNLDQTERMPDDAAVLIVAGPKQRINQDERKALEEYILGGGRVVFMLDPGSDDTWARITAKWGVQVSEASVADAVSAVAGEPLTPLLQRANAQFNSSQVSGVPIADQLDVVFFPGVAAVEPTMPLEDMPFHVQVVPLAWTTGASWLETNLERPNFDADTEKAGPFWLAVAIQARGTVDQDSAPPGAPMAKMVIFGDSDFAKNLFFYSNDNADLLLNSVNWLAEDYDLISIRPKVAPFRELVVTTRERDFIKWSSWFVPPTVMLLLGVIVWWRRR